MKRSRPLLHTAAPWARGVIVGIAMVTVALYLVQRSVLYHPGPRLTHEQFQRLVDRSFAGAAAVIPDFDAIVLEPTAPAVATAIWFHGNAGRGGDRAPFAKAFTSRGIRLVLAEYPGYAARAGSPSEEALVSDATALVAKVRQQYPDGPLMLVGESLGSGVAVQVAAHPPKGAKVDRLVLLTPYESMERTAREAFPVLPWAGLLLKDKFDSATALMRHYRGSVSVLIAEKDEVVGAAQGHDLAAVARARPRTQNTVLLVRGEGHNTWRNQMTPARWEQLLGLPER